MREAKFGSGTALRAEDRTYERGATSHDTRAARATRGSKHDPVLRAVRDFLVARHRVNIVNMQAKCSCTNRDANARVHVL